VPVVSHAEPPPPIAGEPFPNWYSVTPQKTRFPEQVGPAAEKVYDWYHRHASAACAAQVYAEALI
jgi:hypothetical protein